MPLTGVNGSPATTPALPPWPSPWTATSRYLLSAGRQVINTP